MNDIPEQREASERVYCVKFQAQTGMFTQTELEAENKAGCDAMALIAIMRENPAEPHQGTKTFNIYTVDGFYNDTIPDTELFQVFAHIADALTHSQEIPLWQKEIVKQTMQRIRLIMGSMPQPLQGENDQEEKSNKESRKQEESDKENETNSEANT